MKHGGEFGVKSPEAYLAYARQVMKEGIKVNYLYKGEVRAGFVQLIGQTRKGMAKFAFVGTNSGGHITTMHVETSKQLWQTLNRNKHHNVVYPAQ
ncbi:hypothetical protein ACJJIU_11225 [Microbulbifer sp. CnH-101-E]|uniref:hypothetical protein n=1 Tax=unclassified Microbulbifer TaxID=2619833 RepID=UPI004039E9E3